MSDALFLTELADPRIGQIITLTGEEARHAVAVRRIAVGEYVILADGAGLGARGPVVSATKTELRLEVAEILRAPAPPHRITVVQALAKGERADLAVATMTELGVAEILAWQASRSIVRWSGERGERALGKWRATAREATKQSRRLRVPQVDAASTERVIEAINGAALTLILHEAATAHIAEVRLPDQGEIVLIVGPEGGIAPDELDAFVAAGGRPVLISDGVLRTSTAGAVALGQLDVMGRR